MRNWIREKIRAGYIISLLILGYFMLEVALYVWLAGIIGAFWSLMLMPLSVFIGVVVVRGLGGMVLREMLDAASRIYATSERQAIGANIRAGSRVLIAGVLFIIPGLISDFVAIILLLPVIGDIVFRVTAPENRAQADMSKVVDLEEDEYHTSERQGKAKTENDGTKAPSKWQNSTPEE